MRVLAVASSYPLEPDHSAGHFVRTGLLALAERGHAVTIVHPHPGGDVRLIDDPGVRRHAVPTGGRRSQLAYRGGMPERLGASRRALLAAPRLARALRGAARDLAATHDAVLSHWLVPGGWAGAATGLPHVCVLHSGGVHLLRRLPFGRRLATHIARRTDHLVAVSGALRETFLELLPGASRGDVARRTHVQPDPLPDSAFDVTRERAERPLVLFLGRLEPVKGVDVLLDALRDDDTFDVVVAGEGSAASALRRTALERGLKVTFPGHVEGAAKRDLLGRADLMVVPSRVLPDGRTEGAPTVVAEAHAAGLPVVATCVGGLPEMLRDGRDGVLCPPADAAALRAALERAIGRRDEFAADCRAAASRYRRKVFAERVGGLLEELLVCPA